MVIYVPVGKVKTDSLDLNTSQFSISGTTVSITPSGVFTFATDAEAITGTSTTLMMNPANTAATIATIPAGNPTILDSAVASTTVGNTANETTLYTFSIPANTLGIANALKLTIIGTWLQNASKSCAVKLKYGGTTVATIPAAWPDSDPDTTGFKIEAYLVSQGATNSQYGQIMLDGGNSDSAHEPYSSQGTGAEDSTGALNLVVTVQWSGANASATLTSKYAILEKITGV